MWHSHARAPRHTKPAALQQRGFPSCGGIARLFPLTEKTMFARISKNFPNAAAAALILALAAPVQAASADSPAFRRAMDAYKAGNYSRAVRLIRPLAEQGYAVAQYNLGVAYGNGLGVTQNDQQAAAWYRKAAEQGYADAQYNLGGLYDSGKGVPQNDRQAAAWWRKAAEQGFAPAQSNLGTAYENGQGVAQDDKQAAAWYRKAAEQGYADAQYNLGVMYYNGRGVPQNRTQAAAWWRKVLAQPDTAENARAQAEARAALKLLAP
ncbi:tetratricopeptide repeat protein [Kingella potus]|nr:tetratricopeptide repeat protein [Kingella potus]UOP00741.1 sel1 repeat family protein [Kingella potus]